MKAKASSSRLLPLFRSSASNIIADYLLGMLSTGAAALISRHDTSCPAKAGDTVSLLSFVGIVLVGGATFLLARKLTIRHRPSPLWLCLLVSVIAMAVYFVLTVVILLTVQQGGLFACVSEGSVGLP